MSLKVTVQANPNQLMISVPEAGWSEQLPNIIALDKDDKICAIGEEAEEMSLAEDYKKWRTEYRIRFINPFELDKYGVQYAVAIINFQIDKALKKMRRDLTLGRLFNRFDFDIWLWNYDFLLPETKYEFEDVLRKKPFLKVGQVLINDNPAPKPPAEFFQKRRLETRQRKIADYSLRLFGVIWMMLLFVGLYWLIPRGVLSNPVTFDKSGLSIFIILIVFVILIAYFGVFLGAISWMYVMRRYLPVAIIKEFLPKLGISKPVINWAAEKILG